MSSNRYPYVSEQYKHLLPASSNPPNNNYGNNAVNYGNNPANHAYGNNNANNYYQPPQYFYQSPPQNQHQTPIYQPQRPVQHQPIVNLPPNQQFQQNNPHSRPNHNSYAVNQQNPQYPNLNPYFQPQQQANYAKETPRRLDEQTPQYSPEQQIIHKVEYGDTLEGLSLVYDTPIGKIKQRNGIEGDSIYYLKQVIIPNPKASPLQTAKTQQLMIEEFMGFMPMQQKSDKVARFYLEDHQWNMENAVKAFKDDLEWERKNKVQFNSVPVHNSIRVVENYSRQQLLIKKGM